MPWQWLMIIPGAITFITSIVFWFGFPDSPTNAWFLTPEERVWAVQRIKGNQAGVENKHWKRDQFMETFRDPKTWVLAFFAGSANIVNSLTNQRQLIVNQLGFTPIQTTLLGCVDGAVEILSIWLGVYLASRREIGRGYAAVLMYVPGILGAILVNTLAFHNKVGLLFSYWLCIFAITPFVIFLGWVGSITAGHTKKTTTNAVVLCSYAIGNAAGPLMWKKPYQPRNHVPWAIITACNAAAAVSLLFLRYMLASENKRRQAEQHDSQDEDIYITYKLEDGTEVEKKVDKAFRDLTDIQNREFRYVL